ncbi:MAG: hypothetical protein WKG07_11885 [Hymenobacter sp.]
MTGTTANTATEPDPVAPNNGRFHHDPHQRAGQRGRSVCATPGKDGVGGLGATSAPNTSTSAGQRVTTKRQRGQHRAGLRPDGRRHRPMDNSERRALRAKRAQQRRYCAAAAGAARIHGAGGVRAAILQRARAATRAGRRSQLATW